jgi:hypothetical protein
MDSRICKRFAVEQNGYIIEHVKEQTPEICLAAVKQNSNVFEFVKQTLCWVLRFILKN